MQVGISNAGEVSRVYVGYKCSKKLCSPNPAELVSCAVLPNHELVLAFSSIAIGLHWLQGSSRAVSTPNHSILSYFKHIDLALRA